MKIAVAGYGMMGSSHIASLRSIGQKADMILGRDPDQTKRFAGENGIPGYTTDPEDLFRAGIEVLHVCTPPQSHYGLIKQALENGIHVICEKPFVLDDKQAEELVALAEKKGVIHAVGFNSRFHAACLNMHELIQSGDIGKVLLVNGSYMQEFHSLPCPVSWRSQDETLATTEIGSHWIDLMRFLTGKEVTAVSATFGKFFPDRVIRNGVQYPAGSAEGESFHTDSDDAAVVTFRLSDGSIAGMVLSEVTSGRINYLEMTVTGTYGSCWWNSEDLNRFHTGKKGAPVSERVLAFEGGFRASISGMLAEIYDDIQRGRISEYSHYATFRDGMINTRICSAICRSAANNSVWEIPV